MEKYVKLKDVNDMLVKMHEEPRYQHEGEDYHSGVAQVAVMLIDVPTIEIEEPRVGKWLNEDFPDRPASRLTMAICSVCGGYAHRTGHGYNILSKYCPYCGAKMEE